VTFKGLMYLESLIPRGRMFQKFTAVLAKFDLHFVKSQKCGTALKCILKNGDNS